MRAWLPLLLIVLPASQTVEPPSAAPKSASTVTLAYEIGEADVYYNQMMVTKAADGSFFMANGWDNGYFGLQQYDGEAKRAVVFTVWNGSDTDEAWPTPLEPVQILYANANGKTNTFGADRKGAQFMRQFHWKVDVAYQFVIDAVREGRFCTYTAWLHDPSAGKWEKLATFRGYSAGKWLRGYNSFIEDLFRNTHSATDARRAQFGNVWIHQYKGTWAEAFVAMFVASASKFEAQASIDAGERDGWFTMATGGATAKTHKVGSRIGLPDVPFRKPEMPTLPFIDLHKPEP